MRGSKLLFPDPVHAICFLSLLKFRDLPFFSIKCMKLGLFLLILKYTVPCQSVCTQDFHGETFSLIYSFLPFFVWVGFYSQQFSFDLFAYVFSSSLIPISFESPKHWPCPCFFWFSSSAVLSLGPIVKCDDLGFSCNLLLNPSYDYILLSKTFFPPTISLFGCLLSFQSLSNFAEDLRGTEAWSWGGFLLLPYNPASLQLARFSPRLQWWLFLFVCRDLKVCHR